MPGSAETPDWRDWHLPLSREDVTMGAALADLKRVGAAPDEIPLVVRLVENPRYDIPGFDIFHGAVDLDAHDCIHILLGRGLMAKDEAFIIGFTMGSTGKVSPTEERLFTLVARHLYPGIYKFGEDDVRIFRDALRLAVICGCRPLDAVPYSEYRDWRLADLRRHLGVETDLLRAYYAIERRRFPDAPESRRLLD